MKKTILAAMCAALMMTSCTTPQQFYGTTTGAAIGGLFGSAIGGITGGPRGSDVGALAGMLIGGAVGAAATAPDVEKNEYRSSDYYTGSYRQTTSYNPYSQVVIENLRYVGPGNSEVIYAGDHATLVFDIRNAGNRYVTKIAPVITVTGTKQIYLSPTAIVSELAPGDAVRYQAEVVATDKLKSGTANFSIGFADGNQLYTVRSFQMQTRSANDRRPVGIY